MKYFMFILFCYFVTVSYAFVNGTRDYAIHESPRRRGKHGSIDSRPKYCKRQITTDCENINTTTVPHFSTSFEFKCFGTYLPYKNISLDLLPPGTSVTDMLEIVDSWEILRRIPKCWAVVQPLICAFHMPRCESGSLDLPSQDMCRVALGPCKLLGLSEDGFPSFLNCNDTALFPPHCKNDVRDLKYNISTMCPPPLVPVPPPSGITISTDPQRHYPGVEGCSLPCDTPLFSTEELGQLQRLVAWGGTVALLLNFFVVATYLVDWGSAARYPALIMFYLNLCCMISTSGFLLQFLPGARSDILCRKDGTARGAEPSAGENLSCVMIFVVVYYFLMAALVWFVIQTFVWYSRFKSFGRIKENMDATSAYFHLAAWSLPLVMTITTLTLGEVHADSSSGVCFVGTAGGSDSSIAARFFLLIVPVTVAAISGGFFLIRGVVTLVTVRIKSQKFMSPRMAQRIQTTTIRMSAFTVVIIGLFILTITCHIYEYRHAEGWYKALHRSVICHTLEPNSPCLLSSQPSLSIVQLHLLAPFIFSAVVASWLINSKSKATWTRFIRRRLPCCFGQGMYSDPRALAVVSRSRDGEVLERGALKDLNIQKHKVIARAFAKRKFLHEEGRLSISFRSSHGDPLGMALDEDSQASSRGFSSTWAAALPQLVTRRNAIAHTGSLSSVRRNSVDSDISISVRRVSMESRRNSMDSQISLQISEIIAHQSRRGSRSRHKSSVHAVPGCSGSRRHVTRDKRHKWGAPRRSRTPRVGQNISSRASVSSLDPDSSQTQFLKALQLAAPPGLNPLALMQPGSDQLTNRRLATAGIEGPSPTLLAKLRLPSNLSTTSAEDVEQIELTDFVCKKEETVDLKDDKAKLSNGRISSGSESSSESSSSSFSPELSLLASNDPSIHARRLSPHRIDLITHSSSNNRSSRNSNKKSKSPRQRKYHRTSPKIPTKPSDSSESDEEVPFLAEVFNSKEFPRKSPSQTSKTSSRGGMYKETREIGIQACLDDDIIKKKSNKQKRKELNSSLNSSRKYLSYDIDTNRSKSAGHT